MWDAGNNRMRQFGLESFVVAGYRVDPLHIVAAVLGFILSGPMMLAIVIGALVISQSSGNSADRGQADARRTGEGYSQGSSHYARGDGPRQSKSALVVRTTDLNVALAVVYVLIYHIGSRRQNSTLPSTIAPLFQYASECYFTQGFQFAMESLHGAGLSWPLVFIASGVGLRIASSPLHIFAEKLFARRLHAQNFFTEGILKKLSEHYKVELVPNATRTKLELKTTDPKIISHSERLVTSANSFMTSWKLLTAMREQLHELAETIPQYMTEHGLQATRIQNLKMCTIPLWIFSSFAVRNVISSDFHPSIAGGLWVPDLLLPDPYFVLPIAVGVFGFLNLYSQRKIYPVAMTSWRIRSYDFFLGFFTLFAVTIMSQLPACIPLYWLTVSVTGFIQANVLRHPKVKKALGIT
ncbi:unnamed protein product, partial [Nippostrongylus brasiliensis]|uniref:DUF221-domain-containing protein n=1 Tax=Nippostrongylus brasiliensis TaxID=27835 RepID=A0A0N4YK37_NIPBR